MIFPFRHFHRPKIGVGSRNTRKKKRRLVKAPACVCERERERERERRPRRRISNRERERERAVKKKKEERRKEKEDVASPFWVSKEAVLSFPTNKTLCERHKVRHRLPCCSPRRSGEVSGCCSGHSWSKGKTYSYSSSRLLLSNAFPFFFFQFFSFLSSSSSSGLS